MEERKEKKPNYRIWHFGKDRWHKVTDERFYAENDDAAYEHLIEFEKKTPVGDGKKFYYSSIHYIRCIDDNGKQSPEFDLDDILNTTKEKFNSAHVKNVFEQAAVYFGSRELTIETA